MTSEPRAVIDTNVLISAVISPPGKPRQVLNHIIAQGILLASSETLAEIESRLLRTRFRKYVDIEEVQDFINFLRGTAYFFAPVETITDCRDPDDNKFLELAVSGGADVIISGDGDLLVLHPFRNIPVLSPADFLEVIESV